MALHYNERADVRARQQIASHACKAHMRPQSCRIDNKEQTDDHRDFATDLSDTCCLGTALEDRAIGFGRWQRF
jgi:hypothetical protein